MGRKKKTVLERNVDDHQLQHRRIFEQYKRNLEREEALNEAVLDAEDQEVWKHWNKD